MPGRRSNEDRAKIIASLKKDMYYLDGFDVIYDDSGKKEKRYLDPDTMKPRDPYDGVAAIQTSPLRAKKDICKDCPNKPGLLEGMVYLWGLDLVLDPRNNLTVYRHPETRLVYNGYTDIPAFIDPGSSERFFQQDRGGIINRTNGPACVFPINPEDNLYIVDGRPLAQGGHLDLARKIVMEPEKLTLDEIYSIVDEESKRIAIERFGLEEFIKVSNAKVLDEYENVIEGTHEALFELYGNKEGTIKFSFFCGVCRSTGRVYFIRVPNPDDNRTIEAAKKFMTGGMEPNKCVGAS
jgi:hypothetical protein